MIYNFGLPTDANNLYATLNSVSLNPQTQTLPEGQVVRLAFINQGADLLADTLRDENLVKSPQEDWSVFTKFSRSSLRYNTGSHVDVQGSSLLAGLAKGFDLSSGVLTLGGFFEAGWGDFASRNKFSDSSMVKGKGNTDYQGGGVLGRFDFGNGLYAEGSLRTGRSKVDFRSYDFSSSSAESARYDSSSPYYGLHAGIGYLWSFTETSKVDVSTKYLWNHQEGDSVRVLGDKVEFEGADSQRWRTGVKYLYTANETLTPYIGLAYEYEFDGKVNASIYNQSIDAPSLKGSTVIGELGLNFKSKDVTGLALGLAVQGYSGKAEGLGSRLQAIYEF